MNIELQPIKSDIGEITLRRYQEKDIPTHAAYLYESPKEFLESIGFDTSKLNNREAWEASIRIRRKEGEEKGEKPNVMVAEYQGRAISMVFLDQRNPDCIPRLHFHIFDPNFRGKGLGGIIFMAGMKELARIHNMKRFLIEPKASNERMNGLMKKLKFNHLKNYVLNAGPVTQEMLVSQYEILV